MLKDAQRKSRAIVSSAKQEAADMIADAEAKASSQAKQIIENGRRDVAAELAAAKKNLRSEMIDLVVEATASVTRHTVDARKDKQLIEENLRELQ